MKLVLIAAVARNGVIGRDNDLPWRLPEDLKFFRNTTLGHPVLMGRRNWDSLPPKFRPLPGRRNLVLTRSAQWQAEGAEVVSSLDAAISACAGCPTLYVIGGGEVYRLALPQADELILTEVEADVPGDVCFPDWDRHSFVEVSRERPLAVPTPDSAVAQPLSYSRAVYRRRG